MDADEKLAGFVTGLTGLDENSLLIGMYLVGSYALDDVRPESDIDFLGVLRRPPDEGELSALVALHGELDESWPVPFLDGHYVLAADLRLPADDAVPALRYLRGERIEPAAGALTPVEWVTLKSRGVRLTGAPVEQLDINVDGDALCTYCRRNLAHYWRPQVERLAELAAVESLVEWVANQVSWIALGVPRLLASIATGEVLSKTGAGRYALERFPEWHDVLEASLEQRRDPRPERIPALAALALDVVAFGRHCIEVALSNGHPS